LQPPSNLTALIHRVRLVQGTERAPPPVEVAPPPPEEPPEKATKAKRKGKLKGKLRGRKGKPRVADD